MPFLMIRNDITKVAADAIVNPANRNLLQGSGTSRAIYQAAGEQELTAACEAITDWLLSEEGQSYIVKGWMHSVLKDFPTEPYDGADTKTLMETNIPVDWERCYKNREEIRTMFQEKVTIE